MATNRKFVECNKTYTPLSGVLPAAAKSNDPVIFGQIPGVCATDAVANIPTMYLDGIFSLSVQAELAPIAAGDILYIDPVETPVLSNTAAGGIRYGYALEAVGNGLTKTILVKVGY